MRPTPVADHFALLGDGGPPRPCFHDCHYFLLKRDPAPEIDRAIRDAESKFGIAGIRHILSGRFLEGPPPLGVLMMREPFDPGALTEFFRAQARRWIARSVVEGT